MQPIRTNKLKQLGDLRLWQITEQQGDAFIKKWDNKLLADSGAYVSKEFSQFQTAFGNHMKKLADYLGCNLVKKHKGHYDMSCFFERGGKYVYLLYSNALCGERSRVNLTGDGWITPIFVRTAKSDNDYTGGHNHHVNFEELPQTISRLLKE